LSDIFSNVALKILAPSGRAKVLAPAIAKAFSPSGAKIITKVIHCGNVLDI
jgi:hypothetical protein